MGYNKAEIKRKRKSMDKSEEFKKYRETYQEFWYRSYSVHEDEKAIYLEYEFEIPNSTKFHPK